MGEIYRVDSKCRPHRPQQFKFTPGEWSYSTRQTPRAPCLNIPLKKQVTSETSITSCLVLQKKQQRNSKQSITKFYDDLILQNTCSNKHNCWSPSLLWQFCVVFTSYVTSTVSKSNSNSKCIISQHCGRLTIPFQFLLSSVEPAASSQTRVRLRHRPDLACLPALDRDLIPLNMHTDQFTGWTLSRGSLVNHGCSHFLHSFNTSHVNSINYRARNTRSRCKQDESHSVAQPTVSKHWK